MNIKHILALSIIALGIWLNLELQDAIAERNGHDWETNRLDDLSPALMAGQPHG